MDIAKQIAVDGAGNVFVAGTFQSTADFGPFAHTSAGKNDGFVAKLSSNGAVLWANRWGGAEHDVALGVGVDSAGNAYALGHRDVSGVNTSPNQGHDVFKFNSSGITTGRGSSLRNGTTLAATWS